MAKSGQKRERPSKKSEELRGRTADPKGSVEAHFEKEDALRELGSTHEELLDRINDGVYLLSDKGFFTYVNSVIEERTGIPFSEILKLHILDIVNPKYHEMVQRNLERVFQGKEVDPYELEYVAQDGHPVTVEVNTRPIYRDGRIVGLQGVSRDITQRKQAWTEARKRGLYLESVLNSAPDAIVTLDASHRILEWNPKAEQIFGYSREETLGRNLDDLVSNPGVAEEARVLSRQVMSGKEVGPMESIRYRKDGTPVAVILAASPIQFEEGLQGIVAVYTDITERKLSKRQLEVLSSAVEQSSEGIAIADREGIIFFCNRAFAEVHGYAPKEVIGKHLSIFHLPEQMEAVCDANEQVLKEGMFSGEVWHSRRDGTPFPGWMNNSLLRDEKGRPFGIIATLLDITNLKQVQEALRQSEERFRKFADEASFEGIMIHDGNMILDVNRQFQKMYGYERKELIGKSVFMTVAPESHQVVKDIIRQDREKAHELMGLGKEGDAFPVEVRAREIPYQGKMVRVAAIRDISERKRAEETLREYQAGLERRVNERTSDLIRAKEELLRELQDRRKMTEELLMHQKRLRSLASQLTLVEERERRQMAANLHDNIGHALALARIKLESIKEPLGPPQAAESLREVTEIVKSAIEEVRSLTFDISPPVLHELGFEEAVEWLVEDFNKRSESLFFFEKDGRIGPLEEDLRIILFQAVRELMVNVAKHSKASKSTVSVGSDGEAHIVIVVEDNGVGFPRKNKNGHPGERLGFGLFNIRERFESIGGEIHIESGPDRGSVITLVAPRRGAAE